jgi:replicative DNA helicase
MNARIQLLGRRPQVPLASAPTSAPAAHSALMDVERHLLACMVRDHTLVDELPTLNEVDFQGAGHYGIYATLAESAAEAEAPSFLTLAATLEAAGASPKAARDLEVVGTDPSQAASQAELLLKASRRRQIANASAALSKDPENEELAAELDRTRELAVGANTVTTSKEAVSDFRARLQRRLDGDDPAVSTGLVDLDRILAGGLRGGQVIVLAARPGEGKSALAQGIAEHVGTDDNGKVALFISLEMLAHEITERRVASASRGAVPLEALRSGELSDEQLVLVDELLPTLGASRMEFMTSYSEDIDGIVATAKGRAKKGDVGLVVMDYLQLIESGTGNATENREQQVAKVCRRIKKLALFLQVPILLLSQLNREGERGAVRRRPRMSDLRESGSIEQDADVILFIHDDTPEEARAGAATLVKTIIVEKQRAGRKGDVQVLWIGAECRFANLAPSGRLPSSMQQQIDDTVPTSETPANLRRVRQIAAANHGDVEGIPPDVLAEVDAIRSASAAAAAESPFAQF